MKLSIIIPAYNEELHAAQIIDQALAADLPENFTREIIVVNDGSTDQTQSIVEKYTQTHPVTLFNQKNQGKTSAVLKGFKEATGDIYLIQDADLEYSP